MGCNCGLDTWPMTVWKIMSLENNEHWRPTVFLIKHSPVIRVMFRTIALFYLWYCLCHVIRTQLAYAYQVQGKNDEAQKLYNQVLKSKYGHHSFLSIFIPIIWILQPSVALLRTLLSVAVAITLFFLLLFTCDRPNDLALAAVASNNIITLNKVSYVHDIFIRMLSSTQFPILIIPPWEMTNKWFVVVVVVFFCMGDWKPIWNSVLGLRDKENIENQPAYVKKNSTWI